MEDDIIKEIQEIVENEADKRFVEPEKGDKGDAGDKGDSGDVGAKGDKGDTGEKGDSIKGEDGLDGNDGSNGQDGKDGEPGKDGKDGEDGKPGKDGTSRIITGRYVYTPVIDRLTGSTDGSTKVFTLSKAPKDVNKMEVSGTDFPIILDPTVDFTVSGKTLTLTAAVDAPTSGATLICKYYV